MRRLLSNLLGKSRSVRAVETIRQRCEDMTDSKDEVLKSTFKYSKDLFETTAVVVIVIARVLGITMFDVQLQGAVAMAHGKIAEMQTGEGKTLAAVPAVACSCQAGKWRPCHDGKRLPGEAGCWMDGACLPLSGIDRGLYPAGHGAGRAETRVRMRPGLQHGE